MSSPLTFEQAMKAISDLAPRGWRLGLDRMQEFARLAGLKSTTEMGSDIPQYLQVAGTNGKGTVTGMIQNGLFQQGFKTGAFFSPFVYDARERVQIGLDFLPDAEWSSYTSKLIQIGETMVSTPFEGPTEFELKTAIGLMAFELNQCDFVALEVGLGGRLDATSVVNPAAGAIVSIGLDHVSILGDTLEEIAFEKAGIIKPSMPIALGVMTPEARQVILEVANQNQSIVWEIGKQILIESSGNTIQVTTPGNTYPRFTVPNLGSYSAHNAAIALASMELAGAMRNPKAAVRGIETTFVPGRNERRIIADRTWLLDGAHNRPSSQSLAKLIQESPGPKKILITSILEGHEPKDFYPGLAELFDTIIVAPIDFHRARNPEVLALQMRELGLKMKVVVATSTEDAICTATNESNPGDLIVVTGSFYLVGEIGRALTKKQSSS